MLSISNVSNSAAAGAYYEQADDYYSKDRSPSLWSGISTRTLGLSGSVQTDIFNALLDGKLPNGESIQRGGAGRRGGTDLTFSAPKSLSMQALIAGDIRLLEAHETAVSRALEYSETLAACRVTDDGITSRQNTGNLLIAQFRHDLSRAADPQLHTHCVILNMTQRSDGAWRALDNEPLYQHKMFLGAYYRSELAQEVKALGFEVRVTHLDGRFELAHIQPAQIKAFSGRSRQIEEKLLAMGKTREDMTAKQLEVIALQTRKAKVELDRYELKSEWISRAEAVGIDLKEKFKVETIDENLEISAANAVNYAAVHLCERDSVVEKIDLLRVAIEHGTGKTDMKAIEPAIDKAVQNGELIRRGDFYTTPQAQQREREILAFELLGRDKLTSAIKTESINNALLDKTLNEDQRDLVTQVLTTKNRIMGVQGSAGTGKTTALKAVNEIAVVHEFKLVGLAPSASAARELESTGISSQTLASLAVKGFAGLTENSLIVLDEAGMVSAKDLHALLDAVNKSEARIVLIGDERQLKAVEAGRPFSQLQDAGMETVYLREIQRQREPQLREAVRLASKGEISASFKKLKSIDSSIIEVKSRSERHERIAQDYAKLAPDARSHTLVLASTNRHREAINEKVRTYLGLEGKGRNLTTYSRKDLSKAQALRTVSYEVGDVVKAERDYKSLGLMKGDFAQVVDGKAGVVTLLCVDDQKIEWNPVHQPYFTALIEHERELSVGDMVRITQNDHKLGLINGERMCVIAIPNQDSLEKSEIILEKSDGNRISLDSNSPLYIDHGYCQTVHSAQGQTCERIMIEALANGGMVNESSYYVAISRATDEAIIYTDDKENLPEALIEIDEKSAALDLAEIDPMAPEMELE